MDGGPAVHRSIADQGGAHASSKTHTVSADADRDVHHDRRRTAEVVRMKAVSHTPVRVAVAISTLVALIATVGAPFKWSFVIWFS